jgi:GNAT superfamily N-acetyltransferase
MDVGQLRLMAERSVDGLTPDDDHALRAWIDQAFGTDVVRAEIAPVIDGVPKVLLSVGQHGLQLVFGARLVDRTTGQRIGWFARRIAVDAQVAVHIGMQLDIAFRGKGIGTELLARAVSTYDALGIMDIALRAGFDLGRWHWARLGFEIALEQDQAAVIAHALRVVEHMSLDVTINEALGVRHIAGLISPHPVTLRDVAVASGAFDARRVLKLARGGIDIDAAMPLGKAILLCGPEWNAALRLRGPSRIVFDEYVRHRRESTNS